MKKIIAFILVIISLLSYIIIDTRCKMQSQLFLNQGKAGLPFSLIIA